MDSSGVDGADIPHTCAHCDFLIYDAAEQQRKCTQEGLESTKLDRVRPTVEVDTDAVVRGAQQGCPFLSMLVANGRRLKYVDGKVTFRNGYRDDGATGSFSKTSGADQVPVGLRIPLFEFDYRDPGVYADITRVWFIGGRSAVITADICGLKSKATPLWSRRKG